MNGRYFFEMAIVVQKLRKYFPKLLLVVLVFSPVFPLLYLINRFQVNVPFWDEWDVSGVFEAFYNGYLIDFLCRQHTDSRMFFPKLIFLFIGLLSGLNVTTYMYLSVFLALITSAFIYVLIQRCFSGTVVAYVLAFFVNLMLFSPVQAENWLWGMQFIFYITPLLLSAGLFVNISDFSYKTKVILNSVFSLIGTFSFANGLLLWPFLFPFNEFFKQNTVRPQKKYTWFYVLSSFVSISVFFLGYEHYVVLNTRSMSLTYILRAFFSGIGGPLVQGKDDIALIAGLVIFLTLSVVLYKSRAELKENLTRYYPWIMIVIYASSTVALISFSRAGVLDTTGSRYTAVSQYVTIAAIIMLAQFVYKRVVKVRIFVLVAASFIFCTLYYQMYVYSVASMMEKNISRETARAALELRNIYKSERQLRGLYPKADQLLKMAENLVQRRVLSIPAPHLNELTWLPYDKLAYGFFTNCAFLEGGRLYVSGQIRNPARSTRIVLSHKSDDDRERFFDLIAPSDGKFFQSRDYYMVFANILGFDAPDRKNTKMSAYGIDSDKKTIFKFSNTCSVMNSRNP